MESASGDSSDATSTQSPSYTLSWSGDSEDSDGISECSDFAQESAVVSRIFTSLNTARTRLTKVFPAIVKTKKDLEIETGEYLYVLQVHYCSYSASD